MADGTARKKGKKNRGHGKNRIFCQAYMKSGQREKNKMRKLRKHLKRHPNDQVAIAVMERGGRKVSP